jgi:hypothetical protein
MNIHTFFRKIISAFVFITIVVLSFVAGKIIYRMHQENKLKDAGINAKLEMIRGENNKLIGQNKVIQLSLAQLEAFYPALHAEIKKMGVKPSRVQHLSSTGVVLENKIITTLRDSIIQDTIHTKQFNYSDAWISIRGEAIGNKQSISITHFDTLSQVVFKGARTNPWLWLFSPRRLTQRISLASPYSKLQYSKTIELDEK